MKKEITCSVCNEKIGEIEKDVITEHDEATYRQMVTCSNGHSEAVLEPVVEEV